MAINVPKSIDKCSIRIHVRPRKQDVGVIPFTLMFVRYLVLISIGAKTLLLIEINGVRSALYGADGTRFKGEWSQEKRNQKEQGDAQDPFPNLRFPFPVEKAVALHEQNMPPNPLILFTIKQAFNSCKPPNK